MFARRSRSLDTLLRDPNFPYHVGRLMGASEMVGHWLATREDADSQEMGKRLSGIVGWFFEEEEHSPRMGDDSAARPVG